MGSAEPLIERFSFPAKLKFCINANPGGVNALGKAPDTSTLYQEKKISPEHPRVMLG